MVDRLDGLKLTLNALSQRSQPVNRVSQHLMWLDIQELFAFARRCPGSVSGGEVAHV